MSAYVVHENHINAILSYVYNSRTKLLFNGEWKDPTPQALTEIGTELLAENIHSVCYRYPQDNPEDYKDEFKFKLNLRIKTPVQLIKACECLQYQSCETPEFENSQAARIIRQIIESAFADLPGYSAADWEITEAA